MLAVFAFFAFATAGHGFFTSRGAAGWLNVAAELGIVAVPVALLMIAGELDLSVGSLIGATSVLIAVSSGYYGLPIWLSIALAVAIGMAVGWFNGIVVTRTGLPSFIVTLVSMLAVAGLALGVTRFLVGTPNVSIRVDGLWRIVFAGRWGFANISIVWWAAISLLAGWVLFRTQFGNWILATGGEVQAAREAGIRTNRVKIALFVLTCDGSGSRRHDSNRLAWRRRGNARTSLRLQQYHLQRHRWRSASGRVRITDWGHVRRGHLRHRQHRDFLYGLERGLGSTSFRYTAFCCCIV